MKFLRSRLFHQLVILALLLMAWTLRLYMLDAQSFWNDEGNTARLVERPINLIIEGAAGDIHPPVYYLLLHAWRSIAGESEFALRLYSALCGTLTVAFAAAIGRMAGGKAGARVAALVLALHPLSIYYSQEARMYAQLGLVSAWLVWAALRWERTTSQQPGRLTWKRILTLLSITLPVAVGLYTQYAFMFVIMGLSAAFGLFWLIQRRDWASLRDWVLAHALGGMLFLPWAPIALGASDWHPPDIGTADALSDILRTLVAGITLPAEQAQSFVWLFILLLILAAFTTRPRKFAHLAVWGTAIVPATLLIILGIYRPAYLKFLTASLASLAGVLSLPFAGELQKRKRIVSAVLFGLALLALCGLAGSPLRSLDNLYHSDIYRRDDYRGITAMIKPQARPGDAILLSAPNQWEVFTYYYKDGLPVYPAPYHPSPEEAQQWLDGIITQHERLFVLYWGDTESDPERRIEPYLAQHAYKTGEQWITSIRLAQYGTLMDEPAVIAVDAQLGDDIHLKSYSLPDGDFKTGNIIPLTLNWYSMEKPAQRYKVFVQVLDANGQLVAQTDSEPGAGFALTDRWPVNTIIEDRYGVQLPDDLVPGKYSLIVGMYGFDGVRLPVQGEAALPGDAILLAELSVTAPE